MLKTKFYIFILISSFTIPVFADEHLDAAIQFLDVIHPKADKKEKLRGLVDQMFMNVPKQKHNKKEAVLQLWVDKFSSRERAEIEAQAYTKKFSTSELNQMTAFIKTPFGQKVFKNLFKVMAESEKEVSAYDKGHTKEFFEKMKAVMK